MYPNLKLRIFKLGLRQSQLAKTLGIDEGRLSKIINGFREPSEQERQALSAYLAEEEAWLFEPFEISPQTRFLSGDANFGREKNAKS